jgi:tetratricopeptide (TPR) repeat protein
LVKRPDADRAVALHDLAVEALRRGNHARARQHFERALALIRAARGEDDPDVASILANLGVVAYRLNDTTGSRAYHEAALAVRRRLLGDAHPDVAESLHNLGVTWRSLGDSARAEACHEEALAIRRAALPANETAIGASLDSLAALAAARHDHTRARTLWEDALPIHEATLGGSHPIVAWTLCNIGVMLRQLDRPVAARRRFEAALEIMPDLALAHHNLASLARSDGRLDEARQHCEAALRTQPVFIEPAIHPERAVLILATPAQANVPVDHLLPQERNTRIWWFPEFGAEPRLPPFDAAFNAIGEHDLAQTIKGRIAGVMAAAGRHLLNDPVKVASTRRDALAATLQGVPGVVVPKTLRLQSVRDAAAGLFPLLTRPLGAHGGSGVRLVRSAADLEDIKGEVYATAFHDFRSPDGFWRKYRVVFVDRVAFPYHLAISENWLIHYFSADMMAHAWKLEEERRFLLEPDAVLGPAFPAIAEIGRRLDLDYCGIDFTLLADGRVLVFEANPTMLVHPEDPEGPLAHKNAHVTAILNAFEAMLERTA